MPPIFPYPELRAIDHGNVAMPRELQWREHVSWQRIGAANSIGSACVAREMEDTEMSRRKKDALQEEGRRTGR